jgi:hypothetical protein
MNLKPYFFRMSLSLFVIVSISFFFAGSLWTIFLSNPRLNTLIIGLTLGGIGYAFYQLFCLKRDAEVFFDVKQGQWSFSSHEKTFFLDPILSFISQKKVVLDHAFAKGLGNSLADKLENERVFPRYLIGLLVFLGLLGTFWGLSHTITSIASFIQNMPSDASTSTDFFSLLKQNLQNPLIGMGTAFSSSLFGLGGSLLIGFLELQVGHAYSRFLNEVDFYLTSKSQHSSTSSSSSSGSLAYLQALLTRNGEVVEALAQALEKSEKNEKQTTLLLDKLIVSLNFLVEHNKAHQNLMAKLVDNQGLTEEGHKHLENIELLLGHSLQQQQDSREEFLKRLREEMRLISRTLGALSDQQKLAS